MIVCNFHAYRKFPKYSDTQKICCNLSKIWIMWHYYSVMSPNDVDGMANSVDPDQTAPLGAVWSGSTLFAKAYLSKNLGSLRYIKTELSQRRQNQHKSVASLHDTPPLCFFLLLRMFWHRENINVHVTTSFDQIHQLFHKILSINIILKSIKGHNSVEKFGKMMCISHSMDHVYINA